MEMLSAAQREAVLDIESICAQEVDSRRLRRRVADRLSRVMYWEAACFGTIDPWTLLITDDVADHVPSWAFSPAVRNEYLVDDVYKFTALARSGSGVGIMGRAPEDVQNLSRRLHSVMPTFGAAHEIRAACVADGQCWGGMAMWRTADHPDFGVEEAMLLQAIATPLAAGLRRAAHQPIAQENTATADDGPGVLILGKRNEQLLADESARQWLAELAPAQKFDGLPLAVSHIATRARNLSTSNGLSAYSRIRTDSGKWLSLHASMTQGNLTSGGVAVVLEPAPASEIAQVLMLAHGLTPREREILQQVFSGASSNQMAAELHISINTVQDHLKAIFAKVGVRSRGQLVARLLDQHYLP